jgi:predicted transcriptional regulator
MRVLLSIKPEYAFKIFEGEKKFEFRRSIFKKPGIKTVVVYASSPVQRVIGEFEIDSIISLEPDKLWEITKEQSGVSKEFFLEYFRERAVAHAIKIKRTKRYKRPLNLSEHFNVAPPQSYVYLS